MSVYQVVWFFLIGLVLTIFAVLDGFDLGVGFWHLQAKSDDERRTLLNAIGPTWDGNEVWLLTGGGALFAAFPPVYASVFSGFYLAMMLVLLALIFRAVSLEFRSKEASTRWRTTWDTVFSLSSTIAGLLFGVAFGNILRGIPLDETGNYTGRFFGLLSPYALLIGAVSLTMFAFQGALFITLKTSGELKKRANKWVYVAGIAYLVLYLLGALITIQNVHHLLTNYHLYPVLWLLPVVSALAILLSLVFFRQDRRGVAFILSSLSIVGLMSTSGAGLFPRLVPALGNLELSLTASNASSSELTLKTMLVLAALGVPLVIAYTIWAYRAFRGPVDVADKANHY